MMELKVLFVSYISAENLSEILGDDFPREEIDAIIAEATGGKHDRISYSEFLKLWEEKKETEREKMIQELADIEEDTISIASLDCFDDGVNEARAEFIGKKIASSAKDALADSDGVKHVGFTEGHVVIPHKEAVV